MHAQDAQLSCDEAQSSTAAQFTVCEPGACLGYAIGYTAAPHFVLAVVLVMEAVQAKLVSTAA
jgi:hypothetical protein